MPIVRELVLSIVGRTHKEIACSCWKAKCKFVCVQKDGHNILSKKAGGRRVVHILPSLF